MDLWRLLVGLFKIVIPILVVAFDREVKIVAKYSIEHNFYKCRRELTLLLGNNLSFLALHKPDDLKSVNTCQGVWWMELEYIIWWLWQTRKPVSTTHLPPLAYPWISCGEHRHRRPSSAQSLCQRILPSLQDYSWRIGRVKTVIKIIVYMPSDRLTTWAWISYNDVFSWWLSRRIFTCVKYFHPDDKREVVPSTRTRGSSEYLEPRAQTRSTVAPKALWVRCKPSLTRRSNVGRWSKGKKEVMWRK